MTRTQTTYRCAECGWTSIKWVGRCGRCEAWGTVTEDATASARTVTARSGPLPPARVAQPITRYSGETAATHRPTGIGEFDRVLGGGFVPGAAVLLSGEPGVGKSTLLLEVASRAAASGARVLYVSAEESVGQVRLRAQRTGALHDDLFLAAETDLGVILAQIDGTAPSLVIVDSVQTVANPASDGMAGQPGQVREVAAALIRTAKDRGIPIVIVGHVTKDGAIAGPRLLEHLVDVVCRFEGDRRSALRFVRALKNRYGSTDEVGCFEMTGEGIAEVPDPSGLFLSGAGEAITGSCVTVTMEGRRALPVEVQALTIPTQAPNPRRVTSGVDAARVSMLLAVLQRRAHIDLSGHDVYVSTVGGVRLDDPGADLAIALALASLHENTPVPRTTAAFGEISLAGRIRRVTNAKRRASEASRLGFNTLLDDSAGTLLDAVQATFGPHRSNHGQAARGRVGIGHGQVERGQVSGSHGQVDGLLGAAFPQGGAAKEHWNDHVPQF